MTHWPPSKSHRQVFARPVTERQSLGGRRTVVCLGLEAVMTNDLKIIVEQHADGFVAYPVGLRGVIVGQGEILDTENDPDDAGISRQDLLRACDQT